MHKRRENQRQIFVSSVSLQKNPGAYPPEPSPAALRLRVLPSPPRSPANDTAAAAVPGWRHRLVSHCQKINKSSVESNNDPLLSSLHPSVCHFGWWRWWFSRLPVCLQGSQCRCRPPSPPVPAPAASAALSALPGLPSNAPLPQEHIFCTSGMLVTLLFLCPG